MRRRATPSVVGLLALLLFDVSQAYISVRSLLHRPWPPSRSSPLHHKLFNSKGGDANSPPKITEGETKDYSSEACALFGTVRVPAALFAGASAAAAFGLPISPSDGVVVGFVKRLYALLMLGALSSQLLAIVVSTTSMAQLSYYSHAPTKSLDEFIKESYDFEWITILANFFFGMLSFVFASGIRAWISIACPIVAQAALGVIVSSTLLAVSFLNEAYHKRGESIVRLPIDYDRYLIQHARRSPLYAMAVILTVTTYAYIAIKIPHIYSFLSCSSKKA